LPDKYPLVNNCRAKAAVLPGAKEFAPRRKTTAEYERGGGNSVGHCADSQTSAGICQRRAAICGQSGGRSDYLAQQRSDKHFSPLWPGTILDAHANIEYDFPAASVDAANFVAVLQAELRAIASRLVMPEFMLTSDASNANFASTMVAEGPAMRMFARLQAEQVCDDLEVIWRAVRSAVAAGKAPRETESLIEIQAAPPSLVVRDQLQETQRFRIENAVGILSPQTWTQRDGLDYDQEQANFAAHRQGQKVGLAAGDSAVAVPDLTSYATDVDFADGNILLGPPPNF
jgi:hypothetical protein